MKTQPTPPPTESCKRRSYSKEFKQEAVRLAGSIGARQAAADLGIHATMLRDWTGVDAELARMRREISVLKQEREILKKAAEFWVMECQ